MDTMAKALLNAAAMIEGGELTDFVKKRYAGWKEDLGQSILNGEQSLESLATFVHENDINPKQVSGRQELLENIVNRYV
jgi:xylose isomerase